MCAPRVGPGRADPISKIREKVDQILQILLLIICSGVESEKRTRPLVATAETAMVCWFANLVGIQAGS